MRPTADYLQQHKFTAREAAATGAVRALLPLVQQARTHMAEMALMAGIEAQQAAPLAAVAGDGAFSWREPHGTLVSPAGPSYFTPAYPPGAGTLIAAQQQHLQQAPAARQQTVAGGVASPPAVNNGAPGSTVVVRQSPDSTPGWGSTVVSPSAPSPARGRRVGACAFGIACIDVPLGQFKPHGAQRSCDCLCRVWRRCNNHASAA